MNIEYAIRIIRIGSLTSIDFEIACIESVFRIMNDESALIIPNEVDKNKRTYNFSSYFLQVKDGYLVVLRASRALRGLLQNNYDKLFVSKTILHFIKIIFAKNKVNSSNSVV